MGMNNPQRIDKSRETAMTDEFDANGKHFIVDTVKAFDTGKYETGIEIDGDNWIITEKYETQEEAAKGHEKWIVECKKQNSEIKDYCDAVEWAFGDD